MGPKQALEAIILTPSRAARMLKLTRASLRAQAPSRGAPHASQASSNDLIHHLAKHIGQAEITPLETVG